MSDYKQLCRELIEKALKESGRHEKDQQMLKELTNETKVVHQDKFFKGYKPQFYFKTVSTHNTSPSFLEWCRKQWC